MIPVTLKPEPPDFDQKVRQPGLRALKELVGDPTAAPRPGPPREKLADRLEDIPSDKLPPAWRECLDDLYRAYEGICAYTCFKIEKVTGNRTVDHFVPRKGGAVHAYEWSNYRLACGRVNSIKGAAQSTEVLDPFEVKEEWFELCLVDFAPRARKGLSDELRDRIEKTIRRLNLDAQEFRERHEDNLNDFRSGDISFAYLQKTNPFLARELVRQGRVREKSSPLDVPGVTPEKPVTHVEILQSIRRADGGTSDPAAASPLTAPASEPPPQSPAPFLPS